LWVGQKLTIPVQNKGTIYMVQSGDSLWKIAQKFGVSMEALANINNLGPNAYLQVGQKLNIPQ
jgi:spore germination protein